MLLIGRFHSLLFYSYIEAATSLQVLAASLQLLCWFAYLGLSDVPGRRRRRRRRRQALREIDGLIRVGDLPDTAKAPELAALRRDLRNGIADLRRVYPALSEMAEHRRTAHVRPLTEAEQAALERALDAFEEIVNEELQSELREDATAVREAEPETLEPDLSLPEGRLKHRLYRLGDIFIRVYRLAKNPAARLREIFDQGVNVAKRVKDYQRAAETLGPVFRALRDWLLDFIS